ncbi:hypothetical protein CSQ88_02770 [Iodobacter sp. BJB302]|nr:hypothetical protein CSQ88_02770 [Iodobacter sp. BJB302]
MKNNAVLHHSPEIYRIIYLLYVYKYAINIINTEYFLKQYAAFFLKTLFAGKLVKNNICYKIKCYFLASELFLFCTQDDG